MTEKVLQEFRIIETEDGFRIEIKGDKEALRDWVMGLDPRGMGAPGVRPGFGPGMPPFGPWMRRGRSRFGRRFGPPWMWDEDDDEDMEAEDGWSKRKRGRGRGMGRGPGHGGHGGHGGHHGHGDHGPHDDVETDTDEA